MTGAWDSSSRFCKDRHVLHKVIHQDYDGYSPRKIDVAEGGGHCISKEIPEEADAKVHERSSALVGKMFINLHHAWLNSHRNLLLQHLSYLHSAGSELGIPNGVYWCV